MTIGAVHPQNSRFFKTLRVQFACAATAVALGLSGMMAAAAEIKIQPPRPQTAKIRGAAKPVLSVTGDPATDGNRLAQAVLEGDEAEATMLLERGVGAAFDDNLALVNAALTGNINIARTLLQKGADANARQGKVLTLAAMRGHQEMVDFLLDNPWSKADPNGNEHWPLAIAARGGFVTVMRSLKKAGAHVNGRDGFALANAIGGGQTEAFHVLLDEMGADPKAGNGLSLAMAIDAGRKDFVEKLLVKGAVSNMQAVEDAIEKIKSARQNGGADAEKYRQPVYDDIIALIRNHQAETKPKTTAQAFYVPGWGLNGQSGPWRHEHYSSVRLAWS